MRSPRRAVCGAALRPSCGLESLERRRLLSSSVWEIRGDGLGQKSDVIRVDRSPTDSSSVRATVNGVVIETRPLSKVKTIRVLAGLGDDEVTVDLGSQVARVRVVVIAGSGDDVVRVSGAAAQIIGGTGEDTLVGGDGNDVIDGGAGDDFIQGNGGSDMLMGGDGGDVLAGGFGRDRIDGGGGNDRIHGGVGADNLVGASGTDTLYGGAGRDLFNSGAGRDKVYRVRTADRLIKAADDVLLADSSGTPAFHQFGDESDFDQWLIEAAVRRWQDLFDQPVQPWFYAWDGPTMFKTGASPSAPSALANSAGGGGDHSETNTQVDGVDEADIVETDGTYLYLAVGTELVIVRADPADDMAVVSRTDVGGYISGIYLFDGKVTVLASKYDWAVDQVLVKRMALLPGDIWWGASKTLVATYDVSDAAAPVEKEKTTLDGYLADSRSVDGRVYAVVSNNLWMPPPKVVENGENRRYESESAYRERLAGIVAGRELPQFTTTADGQTRAGQLVSIADTYVSGENDGSQTLTSVVLIDPSAGEVGPDASATIVGPSGTVYATADSLYVTGWDWDEETGVQQTNVAKFELGAGSVSLSAVGMVEGSVLDQYSMGENSHGDLNIATSSGWGNESSNNVYTLRQAGTSLDPIGAILNIAPGERIFSSRFVGDQGYLVTFERTDPLFTLDLSDPEDPRVVGQLDLTGFSSFLQPIEGHYLLGLGHSGDAEGHVGGLQLSLFDVIDPAHPRLVATYSFDGDDPSSGSAAEYDAHAIQYFADQHTLTLPVWRYDSTSDDFVEGTAVIKMDTASGFQLLGFVPQEGVMRSVRIGHTLYTVGSSDVTASDLNIPAALFGTVRIADNSASGDVSGLMF